MAFLSLTDLVQRCVVRLRQVPGVTTQAYAETELEYLIEEVYESCRALRWWDHLTTWYSRTLDGSTGKFTTALTGCREGLRDVHSVYAGTSGLPLTMVDNAGNPTRYTGTVPRTMEALSSADDPTGEYLFRVWPLASTGDVNIRARCDPTGVFTTPSIIVPFDATTLVNGACFKYAMRDGTNPGSVMEFDRAFNERVMQLQKQHDSKPLTLDPRPGIVTEWREEPWR